jgi:hypothetical protein
MIRFLALSVLLTSLAGYAFAIPAVGPEIDASSGVAALGLLSGAILILRARRKQ